MCPTKQAGSASPLYPSLSVSALESAVATATAASAVYVSSAEDGYCPLPLVMCSNAGPESENRNETGNEPGHGHEKENENVDDVYHPSSLSSRHHSGPVGSEGQAQVSFMGAVEAVGHDSNVGDSGQAGADGNIAGLLKAAMGSSSNGPSMSGGRVSQSMSSPILLPELVPNVSRSGGGERKRARSRSAAAGDDLEDRFRQHRLEQPRQDQDRIARFEGPGDDHFERPGGAYFDRPVAAAEEEEEGAHSALPAHLIERRPPPGRVRTLSTDLDLDPLTVAGLTTSDSLSGAEMMPPSLSNRTGRYLEPGLMPKRRGGGGGGGGGGSNGLTLKKPTRPPVSTIFLSLNLSAENFTHLQNEAKMFMLDPAYPERSNCIGSRGSGDTDLTRLRLFNSVKDFLTGGAGDRFFGPHIHSVVRPIGGDTSVPCPRTWIWPEDMQQIITFVTPVMRRAVTNERQRVYALESRKSGRRDETGDGGGGSGSGAGAGAVRSPALGGLLPSTEAGWIEGVFGTRSEAVPVVGATVGVGSGNAVREATMPMPMQLPLPLPAAVHQALYPSISLAGVVSVDPTVSTPQPPATHEWGSGAAASAVTSLTSAKATLLSTSVNKTPPTRLTIVICRDQVFLSRTEIIFPAEELTETVLPIEFDELKRDIRRLACGVLSVPPDPDPEPEPVKTGSTASTAIEAAAAAATRALDERDREYFEKLVYPWRSAVVGVVGGEGAESGSGEGAVSADISAPVPLTTATANAQTNETSQSENDMAASLRDSFLQHVVAAAAAAAAAVESGTSTGISNAPSHTGTTDLDKGTAITGPVPHPRSAYSPDDVLIHRLTVKSLADYRKSSGKVKPVSNASCWDSFRKHLDEDHLTREAVYQDGMSEEERQYMSMLGAAVAVFAEVDVPKVGPGQRASWSG